MYLLKLIYNKKLTRILADFFSILQLNRQRQQISCRSLGQTRYCLAAHSREPSIFQSSA